MSAHGIVASFKVKLDGVWDSATMSLYGSPQNYADELAERIKDHMEADSVEVVSVEVTKDSQ